MTAGQFVVGLQVGDFNVVSPILRLQLCVYMPQLLVGGLSTLSHSGDYPEKSSSSLLGRLHRLENPASGTSSFLIECTGYAPSLWSHVPTTADINLELRMVIDCDWKSGVCSFKYRDSQGHRCEVNGSAAHYINLNTMN